MSAVRQISGAEGCIPQSSIFPRRFKMQPHQVNAWLFGRTIPPADTAKQDEEPPVLSFKAAYARKHGSQTDAGLN